MGIKVTRESAIAALVASPNVQEAARMCGISKKTLHVWLNEPAFALKLRETQDEVTRQSIGRVLLSIGRSISVLEDVMQDVTTNASPRVAAARTLLEYGFKVYELQTVQQRLEAIERRLNIV